MVDINIIAKAIKRSIISHLIIVSTILTSGAILNFVQVLLHVFVKPVNKTLFHKLMYYISWLWLSQTVFIAEFWSGSEIVLYCDKDVLDVLGKKHHFTLMNHCYEIDWLAGWHLLEQKGMLGNGRGFVKSVIKYIPIAGWFLGLAEHIFLQRSYEKDKQVIEDSLQDILNYPDNAWVVMTAEGTRFTKEKHEASLKFAQERNIQPLKHHLMPRPKGFMTCVPILKKNQAKVTVLNYQLAYNPKDKVEPTLLNILRGEKVTSHIYLGIVPMDQIEATPECLLKVYREKDELHESFMKYGNFYEGRNMKPIEGVKLKPRGRVLINGIFWYLLNFSFMMYYATSLILAGRFVFLLSVSSAIIALFYILMHNIISHSKVNKGSQYGK